MPDSTQVFVPAFFVPDSNGDPVSGAKINVYDAGTTDAQTVYSDSALTTALPNPIICDAAGMPTTNGTTLAEVYVGTAAYKLVITDSADVTLYTFDNIQGALDTSGFSGGGSGTYSRPVTSKSADYSVVSGDQGDRIQANPTGGTFTITFPSAVTVGDGFAFSVRHDGTANQVRFATVSSQTIDVAGAAAVSGYALTGMGHEIEFTSDGANWIGTTLSTPLIEDGASYIVIVDRLTAPPTSPNAGACYILNGTGTGDWSGFSEHDVLRADGQGGWIQYTPPTDCGWEAYVQDENTKLRFEDSAWVDLDDKAPTATNLGYAKYQLRKTNNTSADAQTASAWTALSWTDEDDDTITISPTLPSSTLPVPTGTYLVIAEATVKQASFSRLRVYNNTDSAVVFQGVNTEPNSADNSAQVLRATGFLVVTEATENISVEYYINATGSAPAGVNASAEEVYGQITLIDLGAQQGPSGAQGTQGVAGADGGISFWNWETATTSGPSSGAIRFNNATFASVTSVFVHETDGNSVDMSALLATFDDSTATVKGLLYLHEDKASSNFWAGQVTALTDNGSDVTLTVTHVASNGSFDAGDDIKMEYYRTGDDGAAGAAGATGASGVAWLDYQWETATSGDPGSGKIRVDNGTYASLTEFAISETDRIGSDVSGFIASLDNSNSTTKATLRIIDSSDNTNWLALHITSALTDQGTYDTFTATYSDHAGTLADDQNVVLLWVPHGDAGSGLADIVDDTTPQLGGNLDTNSQHIDFDDAHGIRDDSGNEQLIFAKTASAVNHLQGTNAATTNHPRLSAVGDDTNINLELRGKGSGIVDIGTSGTAVQKADGSGGIEDAAATDLGAGDHMVPILASTMIPRTTNGPESAQRELATNDVMLDTLNFDTTTEEGCGFWFPMPESWDESTVTFQALWTAASGSGGVAWGLAAYSFSNDDAMDTAVSGQQVVTDTFITANDCHITSESSAITIGGTPAAGDLVYFEVTREVGNGSDTLAVDAELIGIRLYMTTDALND